MKLPNATDRARSRVRAQWAKLGKRRRRLLLHTAILLAIGIVFALITLPGPFASYQLTLSDQLFASQSASPNVVIAAIDDATLATAFEWDEEEERWSVVEGEGVKWSEWPRSRHAQAIRNLANAQARVIGLDVIFAETSNEVRANATGEEISGDELLRQAMEEAGNVVQPILGTESLPSGGGEKIFEEILRPTSELYQASPAIGHANVLPDSDEKVRRLPLVIRDAEEQRYPSLSLAILHPHQQVLWRKHLQRPVSPLYHAHPLPRKVLLQPQVQGLLRAVDAEQVYVIQQQPAPVPPHQHEGGTDYPAGHA